MNYPAQGEAINEFNCQGLLTMAFPYLFPDGLGDPTVKTRDVNVNFSDGVLHLLKFAEKESETNEYVYRFAADSRFVFACLNMIQRHKLLTTTNVFLERNQDESKLTFDEVKDKMKDKEQMLKIMKRMSAYSKSIRGSAGFWYNIRKNVDALFEQKGCPTLFFTLSFADSHLPDLKRLVSTNPGVSNHFIQTLKNPHLVDWYFLERVEKYVKYWIQNILNADWYWFRVEYQHRGFPHVHGFIKMSNDVFIQELAKTGLKGRLAKKSQRNR